MQFLPRSPRYILSDVSPPANVKGDFVLWRRLRDAINAVQTQSCGGISTDRSLVLIRLSTMGKYTNVSGVVSNGRLFLREKFLLFDTGTDHRKKIRASDNLSSKSKAARNLNFQFGGGLKTGGAGPPFYFGRDGK